MSDVNAYPELVAAARQIRWPEEAGPFLNTGAEHSARLVAEHAEQLAIARRALKKPCRVDMRIEPSFLQEHWPQSVTLRELIRLFVAEANVAAAREDWPLVLQTGLELLELGNAMRRGGMILDMLIAVSGSGGGIQVLRKHRKHFDEPQRVTITQELLRLDRESEPIEAVIARDREWEIAADYQEDAEFKPLDPEDEVPVELQRIFHEAALQESRLPPELQRQTERQIDKFHQALLRLLVIDLTLHRYQQKHRKFPNQLHWLAPKLLDAVPLDPFTALPFIYRRHGDSFELYSPGPKLTDAGGVFAHQVEVLGQRADLCLDVWDYKLPECG